jgi:hypothetical protein
VRIDERYRWWLAGDSKFGLGTQSQDYGTLDLLRPAKVLFLDGNKEYAERYGSKSILRTYHGTEKNWKDWNDWAFNCAQNIDEVHGYGCRDLVPINEVFGIEGLLDNEDAYRWMGEQWTPGFLNALEGELHRRGKKLWPEPDGWRLWLFGCSPGHNLEDNFVGLRHLANVFRDPRIFGSVEHYYWQPGGGFFGDADYWYNGIGRLLKVRERMVELGIDKPVLWGEYNRKVDRGNHWDIMAHAAEIQEVTRWANSLPWVVGIVYFLECAFDGSYDFHDFTLNRMPGMIDELLKPWDRFSEGRWAMPQVGVGFNKFSNLIGPWTEDEIYHSIGSDQETSLAVGAKGFATWRKKTNQTIAVCDNGEVYSDEGNQGDGSLVKLQGIW